MSNNTRKILYFVLFFAYFLVYFAFSYVLSALQQWIAISYAPLPGVIVNFVSLIVLGCMLFARARLGAGLQALRLPRLVCFVMALAVWILMLCIKWDDAPMLLLFCVQCGIDLVSALKDHKATGH